MSSSTGICDGCGKALPANAPEGLCPECLLTQVLARGGPESETALSEGLEGITLGELPGVEEAPGRYTQVGEHGKGGMGRVLLVHDEHLKRDVALKELLGLTASQEQSTPVRQSMQLVSRFLREARITGRLEHPSITPVYELGRRKDGTLYYTMKLVRGKTLAQAIKEAGTLKKRLELLPHFVDLCQAIAYAHSRGVIHRDIKPSNVILGEFGETAVIDWGLAKVREQKDDRAEEMAETVLSIRQGRDGDASMTAYGQAMGTPAYMPPEQAEGQFDKVDERSDIYSLGAVLYEILTGKPVFSGKSVREVLDKVVEEAPRPVHALERKAPADLAAVCMKALDKSPAKRPRTAKELAIIVETSKLRKPKGRVRRTLEKVVVLLLMLIIIGIPLANWRSEQVLQQALLRMQSKGISTTASSRLAYLPPAAPQPRSESVMTPPNSASDSVENPMGALYALKLRFPSLMDTALRSPWPAIMLIMDAYQESNLFLPLSPGETEVFTLNIVKNRELMDAAIRISALPPSPLPGPLISEIFTTNSNPFNMRIPDLLTLRQCVNLLCCEASVDYSAGRTDEALNHCTQALRFSSHLRSFPFLIVAMLRAAMINIPMVWFRHVPADATFSEAALTEFERAVKDCCEEDFVARAMDADLRTRLWDFEQMKTKIWVELAQTYYGGGWNERAIYGSRFLRFWINADHTCWVNLMTDILDACRKPYYESKSELIWLNDKMSGLSPLLYPISSQTSPNCVRARVQMAEMEALVDETLLVLQIRKYHATNGAYPDKLDDLAASYPGTFPCDPFTGRPFAYRRDGNSCLLASPGKDGEMAPLQDARSKILHALRAYKKETGHFPESISALQPNLLREIPADDLSGQPFAYALRFEGCVLTNAKGASAEPHIDTPELITKALERYQEKYQTSPESLDKLVSEFLPETSRGEATGLSSQYVRLGPYPRLTITQKAGKNMPCRTYDDIVWVSD